MPADLGPWSRPRSSVDASPLLVVGTMNFGRRTPEADAARIVSRALERGIVHFDTANAYVDGESERILGRALKGHRDSAVISTKVGLSRVGGAISGLIRAGGRPEGLSRSRILSACDESLERLGTDAIDIYYLHVPDPETPFEESLAGIADLLSTGKIRAWGLSNFASWQILEMITWCDRAGVSPPIMTQQLYNLLVRQLDIEYFAFARKYRLHTAAYNPLAGGLLTGAEASAAAGARFVDNPMYQRRYLTERLRADAEDYRRVAGELGMSLTTLSYAFLRAHAGVDSILLGPGTVQHLDEAIDACAERLDPSVMDRLTELHRTHQGTDARYARI